jgi:hypothetical protein
MEVNELNEKSVILSKKIYETLREHVTKTCGIDDEERSIIIINACMAMMLFAIHDLIHKDKIEDVLNIVINKLKLFCYEITRKEFI